MIWKTKVLDSGFGLRSFLPVVRYKRSDWTPPAVLIDSFFRFQDPIENDVAQLSRCADFRYDVARSMRSLCRDSWFPSLRRTFSFENINI